MTHSAGSHSHTKAAASNVAERMTGMGFLGGALLIARIAYMIYQGWSLCHGQAASAYATVHDSLNPNTDEFEPNLFAKARRRVATTTRRKHLDWSDHEVDTFTRELLLEVINSDEASVAASCTALRSESLSDEDSITD